MERLKHSKVLITGGGGFIGSALTEALLADENEVVCLDNFSTGKRKNIEQFLLAKNYKLIVGDIRNYADCQSAVSGAEYVFHQAALGSVPRSVKDPLTTNDVNITGFLNMLNAAKEAKVKRFIYASSSAVYGDHPSLPKTEDIIGNPLSPYAVTKRVNELYARVFSELYDIQVIGLRYFNVFGPRQDPDGPYAAVIPKFIMAYLSGAVPEIYGDGLQSRDFTYVENVVQANINAAVTNFPGAVNTVYNIACGECITVKKLAEMIRSLVIDYLPGSILLEPKHLPERQGDILHSLASIEKAKSHLGYAPDFNILSGLSKTLPWYISQFKKK